MMKLTPFLLLITMLFSGCGGDDPVPPPQIISITTNPVVVKSDRDATFSVQTEGEVSNYVWDFGDGTPLVSKTEPSCVHRFSSIGTFNGTLTIEGPGGTAVEEFETTVIYPNKAIVKSITLNGFPSAAQMGVVTPYQAGHTNIFFVFHEDTGPWTYTMAVKRDVTVISSVTPYAIDLTTLSGPNELPRVNKLTLGVGHAVNATPIKGDMHYIFIPFNVQEFLSGPLEEKEFTDVGTIVNMKMVIQKINN